MLTQHLNDAEYHIDHSSKLTSTIADAIKTNLKQLNLSRCAFLCVVWCSVSHVRVLPCSHSAVPFPGGGQLVLLALHRAWVRGTPVAVSCVGRIRYKLLVQVVIGQQKGEGVRMGTRCFWDAESDNYASDTFTNDSLFCVATAYGVYMY